MNRKTLFFVMLAMLCLAVFTVSVSADQNGNDNWCNSDQYGCWVTGDGGVQNYIMFWSESAREYFMGKGSTATVAAPFPGGKMSMTPVQEGKMSMAPVQEADEEMPAGLTREEKIKAVIDYQVQFVLDNVPEARADGEEAVRENVSNHVNSLSDEELDEAYEGTLLM